MVVTDKQRSKALATALRSAKAACKLTGDTTVAEIIELGPRVGIEPRLYELAWWLHKRGFDRIVF